MKLHVQCEENEFSTKHSMLLTSEVLASPSSSHYHYPVWQMLCRILQWTKVFRCIYYYSNRLLCSYFRIILSYFWHTGVALYPTVRQLLTSIKPGTHLSMHRSTRFEYGYYCECVRIGHMRSWSSMHRTEQNCIQLCPHERIKHVSEHVMRKFVCLDT